MRIEKDGRVIDMLAVAKGEVVGLECVPDPVFSEKMMGEGYAVIPDEGIIYAPISGKVVQIFPTCHAIGIEAAGGVEVLIHVGLDTVMLQGRGFTLRCKEGDVVQAGDVLLEVDLQYLKEEGKQTITPVVITHWGTEE